MTWMIVAFDDDTLAAVLDDARVRSLESDRDFVLVTPRSDRWGNERSVDERVPDHARRPRRRAAHRGRRRSSTSGCPARTSRPRSSRSGARHSVEGVVIAHHNPDDSIPDPEAFDDAIREELGRAAGRNLSRVRLLLVRHGESEWNAIGRLQGQADPPLSELGRHQAAHMAARLVDERRRRDRRL